MSGGWVKKVICPLRASDIYFCYVASEAPLEASTKMAILSAAPGKRYYFMLGLKMIV
jgi:hypothetical protein